MKRGTGIFNYKEVCSDCNKKTLVDINGHCKQCYNDLYICEKCNKINDCVRFEGSVDCYICDSCLYSEKLKGGFN